MKVLCLSEWTQINEVLVLWKIWKVPKVQLFQNDLFISKTSQIFMLKKSFYKDIHQITHRVKCKSQEQDEQEQELQALIEQEFHTG